MPDPTRVLIVDDEPHVRAYLKMLVRDTLLAVEICEAADVTEALARFAEFRPDLVLLDVNIVGGTGLEVLRGIRSQNPGVVVVMITAVNVRHTIEEAIAAGADGYIMKDAGDDEIARTLREILEANNEPEPN